MISIRIILTTLLISMVIPSYGQITFNKLFSDGGSDIGQGAVQLADSSYVITGSSSSFQGSSQAYLLKLDSMGNYIWAKDFGGPESESGRRVFHIENYGFVVVGFTNSIGNGGFDVYIAKLDEQANLEWENAVGGDGWERAHDAIMVADTGLIIVGETSSVDGNNEDIYVVRTDKNGDTLWTKSVGGGGTDIGRSVVKINDSSYVVGGTVYNEDSLLTKGFLMCINDQGTEYWSHELGSLGNYWLNDLCTTNNEIFSVGGWLDSLDGTTNRCRYRNDIITGIAIGGGDWHPPTAGNEEFVDVVPFNGNEVYISWSLNNLWASPGGPDLSISRYTFPFNSAIPGSTFYVNYENPDVIGQAIETSDGGILITGYTTGVVSGGNEIFVAKLGANDSLPGTATNEVLVGLSEPLSYKKGVRWIFPNPANQFIKLRNDDDVKSFIIYDLFGKAILSDVYLKGEEINVSALNKGMYFVEFVNENETVDRLPLLIQH